MEDFNGIYSKILLSERILDEELTQIKELLIDIARKGTKTFILWVQGFESSEMTQRESILKRLSRAGLVNLDWKFTHHNAYIKARITEKGMKLIKLIGIMPNNSVT